MSERWKPRKDEKYWVIAFSEVVQSKWEADSADLSRWQMGNCFKTKEEALDVVEKVKTLLLSLHDSTQDKPMPKLTAEVFDRPDCPDWCKCGEYVYDSKKDRYAKILDIKCEEIFYQTLYGGVTSASYRDLKPARLRPYNDQELRGLVGMVICNGPSVHVVTGYENVLDGESMVHVNGCLYSANDLLRKGFTYDTRPCGVLEHLENGEWVK